MTSTSTRAIAEAFSGHRLAEAYEHLAPDVTWVAVGGPVTVGKDAVVQACEDLLAELASGRADFSRFVSVGDDQTAAVDAVGTYTDVDGQVSVVSSCDIYEFAGGLLARITSYAVELDGPARPGATHPSATG